MTGLIRGGLILFLTAVSFSIVGCTSSFCKDYIECEGGNDADLKACSINEAQEEDLADLEGCMDAYDAYMSCLEEKSSCSDDVFTDDGECDSEGETYYDCMY